MSRRKAVTATNIFACALCPHAEAMDVAAFKAHREQVHGATEHKGRRRATVHLDATDWFEWRYEWLNPEPDDTVIAYQIVRRPRRGLDKATWR